MTTVPQPFTDEQFIEYVMTQPPQSIAGYEWRTGHSIITDCVIGLFMNKHLHMEGSCSVLTVSLSDKNQQKYENCNIGIRRVLHKRII